MGGTGFIPSTISYSKSLRRNVSVSRHFLKRLRERLAETDEEVAEYLGSIYASAAGVTAYRLGKRRYYVPKGAMVAWGLYLIPVRTTGKGLLVLTTIYEVDEIMMAG